jgi:hypothetical protein
MGLPREVWDAARRVVIEAGYGGKIRQAHDICGTEKFLLGVAEIADDLGAPVGQGFMVAMLRTRRDV